MAYIWPIALVVLSNIIYHVCAKSVPDSINPFASLTVTYAVGAVVSLSLYLLLGNNTDIIGEYRNMNWAPYVLGIAIVGLEVGFIYAYKAGWTVSTASIVQSSFLAVALIAIGYFVYRESVTWNKIVGIVICLIGLIFINMKA